MTDEQIAKKHQVALSTVARWRKGKNLPRHPVLKEALLKDLGNVKDQ